MKACAVVLAAAAGFDCGPRDQSVTGPTERSFLLSSSNNPGIVTDLQVTAVSDTSVTLAFTEVDDGTGLSGSGQPASYDVRYEAGAIPGGSAPSVTRGSCAAPVAGTAVGVLHTCTVLGLARPSLYEFQMVALRGTLNADAVFGGLSNVASMKPGAVTDLAIAGVTDTSVTLSFTEANDGTGQPASDDVRYAVGAISWGSAPSVPKGTCATPLAGSAIGAKRTCVVSGLAASTGYSFQLVAFRGQLNTASAVCGRPSNVAVATTAAPAVALVVVSPAAASVTVG